MVQGDAEFCRKRIAEEERLGNAAPSIEAGMSHFQLAMLYRVQLASLMRTLEQRG